MCAIEAHADAPYSALQESANSPPFQAIDQQLAQMQARMQRAEQDAAEAERQLTAVLEPLQKWLEQMRASQEKLLQTG